MSGCDEQPQARALCDQLADERSRIEQLLQVVEAQEQLLLPDRLAAPMSSPSSTWSARATVEGTSAGSVTAASWTNLAPPAKPPRDAPQRPGPAASCRSPGPVTVTSRSALSSCSSSASSRSLPMSGVGGRGRLLASLTRGLLRPGSHIEALVLDEDRALQLLQLRHRVDPNSSSSSFRVV